VWQQYVDVQGGVGWYFKHVDLPEALGGKTLRVRFGAVDYLARVWWNGHGVGSHEGGHTPFEVDITSFARPGENHIAVRDADVGPGMEVDGLRFDEIGAGFQDWCEGLNYCGMWQPVEVVISHPVYVANIFVVPKLSSNWAEVRLEIVNGSDRSFEAKIKIEMKPWKGTEGPVGAKEQTVRLVPGLNQMTTLVDVAGGAHPWSVDDPFLYLAEASLYEGQQLRDTESARFGFREFTVGRDSYFYLNGKRIFVKGSQYQTTEPLTLAFPHNEEMARKLVSTAKEVGSNFMRCQGRPVDPSILDLADELGLLIQSEPALHLGQGFKGLEALAIRETAEMVRRDRNRPSVAIWCMVNEEQTGTGEVVRKMVQVARELDPTRLITESAGGPSNYYQLGTTTPVPYLDEHYYPGTPLSEGVVHYFRTRGVPGQAYFVSECGIVGIADFDAVLERYGPKPNKSIADYRGFAEQKRRIEEFFNQTELKEIFPNVGAFIDATQTLQADAIRLTFEGFRANPSFSGYNQVQLFDSNACEIDGLIDFWRNRRKKAFEVMKEINQPLLLVVQCTPFLNPKVGRDVQVAVTLVNEEKIAGEKKVSVQVTGPSGKKLFAREDSVVVQPWLTRLLTENVNIGQEPGQVVVDVALKDGTRTLLRKTERLAVYDSKACLWPERGIAVFDPDGKWKGWQNLTEVRAREFDPDKESPEVVVVPEFTGLWRRPNEFRKFVQLIDCARRGSTILFIGLPQDGPDPEDRSEMSTLQAYAPLAVQYVLGFRANVASGWEAGWGALAHAYSWGVQPMERAGGIRAGSVVTKHAIFEGLPGPGLMGRDYGNVLRPYTIEPMRQPVENTGPTIKIIPFDHGKVVLCQLRLLENLEQDGLAEKLFANLLTYLDQALELRLRSPSDQGMVHFEEAEANDCREKMYPPFNGGVS
jgi:hypothetical protein